MAKFVSKIPGLAVTIGKKTVRFRLGAYSTSEPQEIGALRKHPLFGKKFKEDK